MAMLAEPRRKQKVINLRAKNSAWSNDSNKFGQKMLEKMGWSEGKGLGVKENGIVEHVIARYKNDEKGLGYEDKNDQWTKHEDDFNSLLSNLRNGSESNEITLHSGTSLEKKSKKSKARVHYHKFTRGKDISRYSEKELANIFGKKSFKYEDSKPDITREEIKITEQVFTEGGNMNDYFKNKINSMKLFSQNNTKDNDLDNSCGFQGFSGTGDEENKHLGFGCQSFSFTEETTALDTCKGVPKTKRKYKISITVEENNINIGESIEVPLKTSKKKKKKNKEKTCESKDTESEINMVTNPMKELEIPRIKKKKISSENINQDYCDILLENTIEVENKKNKKLNSNLANEQIIKKEDPINELEIPKRKKKSKSKNPEPCVSIEQDIIKNIDVYVTKKKKKRKN